MNTSSSPKTLARAPLGRARFPALGPVSLAALIFTVSTLSAQDDRRRGPERGGERGSERGGGDRGNASPQDMQARMLNVLRERMGVTNDDEWAVISERLAKVTEARRAAAGGPGAAMMFAGRGPGGDSGRGGDRGSSTRSRTGGGTEVAALTAAVQDKLPDAEIKSRLDRVRELRKQNEAALAKAQEDLRAVLSVRQEAIAVLAGLLP